MSDRKFILYIFFYILNNSITLVHKAFLQYNSITEHVINSCLNVIVSCTLGGHLGITDQHCFMNESCFISEKGDVIVLKRGSTVSKYQLSVWRKAVVARLMKLDPSFPAVQLLRNKHFQGLLPCWQRKGSLDEDTVLIRDIPEPIIKSSYVIWRWDTGSFASLRQSTT
jgi:hypothetical protein